MMDTDSLRTLVERNAASRGGPGKRFPDLRAEMERLEERGELIIHRIRPENRAVEVRNLVGGTKRIPTDRLWHHKSCGQCGNIPGYPSSLLWLMNETGRSYLNEPHQTSCTAWNYHGTGTSNPVALAAVAARNFHRAYETDHFPLIHCGTSFGDYKEMRRLLVENEDVRHKVRDVLRRLGRELVLPEEIVHYSEWVHVMAPEIVARKVHNVDGIVTAVHEPCHYYKMVPEDAVYDPHFFGGQRPAVPSAIVMALGAKVADYSTWYDCCGFGFRHILAEREFSRSFANLRKIRPMVEEAHADVAITSDTGCVTTLDKSQWIGKAHGFSYSLPILSDVEFVALALGAHPYKIVQVHWHTTCVEGLMTKMGIDWKSAKEEFREYLERLKNGAAPDNLYPPRDEIERYFAINKGPVMPDPEGVGPASLPAPSNAKGGSP
ncbi:MAG TPA: heterodisulfide reductase-related iron-sulfur binding cluster [Thermoplasmata archaeon]|nr:heterodisulfide reductase-related iron-sulfur binding cluster [Thermoplasmata archaeon]